MGTKGSRAHFSIHSASLSIQCSASLRTMQTGIWQKCGQRIEKNLEKMPYGRNIKVCQEKDKLPKVVELWKGG